jgi:transposase
MQRLPMRKIRDVLRLKSSGLTMREIGLSLGLGRTTVNDHLRRAARAGLSWPLDDGLTDTALEALLFPPPSGVASSITQPDWPEVHRELKRPNVTLMLLWEEYRAVHGQGYGYSRFCDLYRRWEGRLSPTMRQHHIAGDKLFVDYAGQTLAVVDPKTGEVRQAQIFVATLGASNFTYAEATWTQSISDWIGAHTRAFAYMGGVPGQIVSDNLKAGITKACFYEPAVNRTYADMAAHYDTAVVPARPRKPRDKAKVEVAVQIAQRWIAARLRNQRFFSLTELNAAIRVLLDRLNDRVTRHLGASRRHIFEAVERAALKPLPKTAYVFSEWRQRTVGFDYHVDIDRHYYSVPHTLLREKVWARLTERGIEIFHKGERVAAHVRTSGNRRHTTVLDHMPASHKSYAQWSPEQLRRKAAKVGPNAEALVQVIMAERKHPAQGFRACLGILALARSHGDAALEAACERALIINARTYSSVKSILANNLHRIRPDPAAEGPAITHTNIRGPAYYH